MATTTEPIIVQIINEVASGAPKLVGGSASIGSSGGKASNTIAGVAKLSGAVGAIIEIAGLIKEAVAGLIRPIKSVLLGILKLVAQFLRPFADMILILLIPLLQMIKPLVKVFNDMMKPFRTVAYQLMGSASKNFNPLEKAALLTGAISALLEGFIFAILAVLNKILKMQISVIIDMIKNLIISPIIELFKVLKNIILSPIIELFKVVVPNLFKVLVPDLFVSDDLFDSTKATIFAGLDAAKSSINSYLDSGLKIASDNALAKYNNMLIYSINSVNYDAAGNIFAKRMNAMIEEAAAGKTSFNVSGRFSSSQKTFEKQVGKSDPIAQFNAAMTLHNAGVQVELGY